MNDQSDQNLLDLHQFLPRIHPLSCRSNPSQRTSHTSWLGDRKGIEKITKVWDKTIIDRRNDLQEWVTYWQNIQKRGATIYAYANNHYAGHGPATVEQFRGAVPGEGN